jgi:hypothetical protein
LPPGVVPYTKAIAALWVGLAAPMVSRADTPPAATWDIFAGATALRFDYKEYNEGARTPRILDREDGTLPGLRAGLHASTQAWTFLAEANLIRGKADYAGVSSIGSPLRTTTDESILDLVTTAGYRLPVRSRLAPTLYAGLGYRVWRRNIRASGPVSGLEEVYRSSYALLGAAATLWKSRVMLVEADVRVTESLYPTLRVDFHGAFDNAKLNLPARPGWRVALPWTLNLLATGSLRLEPYYEYWRTPRSAFGPLTKPGFAPSSVFEPKSQMGNFGVSLSWIRPL